MMSHDQGMNPLSQSGKMLPKEEMLEVSKQKSQMNIGIPRETSFQENRVGLVPDAVALLTQHGHSVMVEKGAGVAARFNDEEFSEAGATIVYNPEDVYKADIIVKVGPPSIQEVALMQPRQTLFSALHHTVQQENFFKQLMSKKVTAFAFEHIKDKENIYPIVRSMSEIAGSTSILIAAEYLSNVNNGKGLTLGGVSGISPTEVIILGAGTVGEFAARAAIGLGAMVKVYDNSVYKLRRLQQNLGMRIYTSIIQPRVLLKALKTADVVIGALHTYEKRSPIVITEDMVSQMKNGSVIVDVSIDQGGCVETSKVTNHTKPVFIKYDVIHYCVPNIPSRVARTASFALSNVLAPVLIRIAEEGGVNEMLKQDAGVRHGAYLFNGILTNKNIGEMLHLQYKDINLLMAAL
ncbi:MAG: alanine dehydrogenase [Bacteroidota bacterium]